MENAPITLSLHWSDLNRPGRPMIGRLKRFIIGAEWLPQKEVTARFGYNNQLKQELDLGSGNSLAGFSAGLGVKYEKYIFEYGFTLWGFGAIHALAVRYTL